MKLRPYQIECVEAVEKYWEENPLLNCGVSLPTGSGKTVIMSEIARRAVERGETVAIIVDRDELVQQTVDKLRKADDMMFVGVVKAAKDEVSADVVVCSVQTLRRPGRTERVIPRDVVIYDEAHGSAADSSVDVMKRLDTIGGPAKAVGFSATFYRADGKPLDVVWDEIVFERSILWAVSEGYLSDARGISVPIQGLDLGGVKMSGGDYQDTDLAQKMMDAHAAEQIVDAWQEVASDRVTICFAPTIAAAQEITDRFVDAGVSAAIVTGSTPAGERRKLYDRLEAAELRVLCSVAVLTTGFDSPRVDCVLMARPTKSQGLYVQCVGRSLRLHPEKDYALILDVSGSSDDHSLAGVSNLAGREKMPPEMTLKEIADGTPPDQMPRGLKANLRKRGEFDPFGRKKLRWLETEGGVEFVSTEKNQFVFLHQVGEDAFQVGQVAARRSAGGGRDGRWLQPNPIPREFAVPLAEAFAHKMGVFDNASGYRRREKNAMPPSVAQIAFAHSVGVETHEGMSSAELSRLLDIARASAVID